MTTYNPFNLELITTPFYKGRFPIQTQQGPLVKNYVDTSFDLLHHVVNRQAKTFIVLVGFQFPRHWSLGRRLSRKFFTRMIEAFKSQLKAFDNRAKKNGTYRTNSFDYLRGVEVGYMNGGLHAHFAFFFNGHAFNTLGDPTSGECNMRYRIHNAWASALKEELQKDGFLGVPCDVKGLVHFGSEFMVDKKDVNVNLILDEAFFQITYLCKLATKDYSLPIESFVSSRF